MNQEERRILLEHLQKLRHREAEAVEDPVRFFLSFPSHRLALRPEIVVVRGVRGAGKSALFQVLNELGDSTRLSLFFEENRLPKARWLDAFSQSSLEHPTQLQLDEFGGKAEEIELRVFWMGHLLRRLDKELNLGELIPEALRNCWERHGHDVAHWVSFARQHVGALGNGLDAVERRLSESDEMVFMTYDHLDRIGTFDAALRRRYVSSLLALWLSLSNRYTYLRGKVFVREDLFSVVELDFPDVTKLRSRSVALDWDTVSLYRLVVHHLANVSSQMREWLRPIRGLVLREREEFGWTIDDMPETLQKRFVDRLAGELMGRGYRKGYTFRWIPNRLQDAQGQIVPRSILCLLGFAAEEASRNPQARGTRLLTPPDLRAGLEPTSRQRVAEIREEFPRVARIENLRGRHVWMDPEETIEALGAPVNSEPQGLPQDGKQVFDELLRLGVLNVRKRDGRVDVPDIYRYGYGIKRQGGVARPR
jgi:hypothetical protein